MTPSGHEALIQQLRNLLLLEGDYLNMHAEIIDACANGDIPQSISRKRLHTSAISVRARAKMLFEVIEATEPEAEAN